MYVYLYLCQLLIPVLKTVAYRRRRAIALDIRINTGIACTDLSTYHRCCALTLKDRQSAEVGSARRLLLRA